MCHSASFKNKVNHIHVRALRIVYHDFQACFLALLGKDNSFTIHQRNLQLLTAEILKVKMSLSRKIMNEFFFDFSQNSAYELRCGNYLSRSNTHSKHFGLEFIANIAATTWNKIPKDIKDSLLAGA